MRRSLVSGILSAVWIYWVAVAQTQAAEPVEHPSYLARAREQTVAGVVAAPDIYPMGFIDKRGPYSAPTGQLAQTLEEARLHPFLRRRKLRRHQAIQLDPTGLGAGADRGSTRAAARCCRTHPCLHESPQCNSVATGPAGVAAVVKNSGNATARCR